MSLDGMDVDQARILGQRLDDNAQALYRIGAMLAALTAELGHYWQGPASASFQHQWAAQYRPALGAAASALTDMHTHLLANIQEQIRTSAADAGPGWPSGIVTGVTLTALIGGLGRAWQIAEKAEGYTSLVTTPFERLAQLDDEGTLLRFKESPILQWLHDNPHVQQVSETLSNTHVSAVLDKVDDVGTGVTFLSMGISGDHLYHDLGQRQYADAGGEIIDMTATGLKSTKDPVLYLMGFDISLYQKDYELSRQIQWNDIPNPFNASEFYNDYIPAFKFLPGQLINTLAEVI
jgi:uncharacterized protein YukE